MAVAKRGNQMPEYAFIFHKELMNADTINALSRLMKPCIEAGTIEQFPIPKEPTVKKAVKKNDYPDWFEGLWGKLLVKVGKPETLKACNNAFKRGYTLEDIEGGIQGYNQEEKRRSGQHGYQKHAPHRWIDKDRFLDGHSNNPDQPARSNRDITIAMHENTLGFTVRGANRDILWGAINDGDVTCDIIAENKDKWSNEAEFIEWTKTRG